MYDKETQQLAIAPLNIGTPATDRDLCLLRYDANGGSGSMNLDQLEDWEMTEVSEEHTCFDLEYVFSTYERRQ